MQPLFRKVAAALPGMEGISAAKQDGMVDVSLKPSSKTTKPEQEGGGCSC